MASLGGDSTPKVKWHTLPYARFNSASSTAEYDDTDFTTAKEVFPMRISLETVQIGSWKYTAKELDDIELLYELESSDLLIKTNISGTQDAAVPAMYRIKNVTAADLSLVSVVPGSLESMVSRLVLETDETISYLPYTPLSSSVGNNEPARNNEPAHTNTDDQQGTRDLDVFIVSMTASVHETGHLRDVLVFLLKQDFQGEVAPNSPFVRERTPEFTDSSNTQVPPAPPQLTLLEGLPRWVTYIPWMLYSKRIRIVLQRVLVLYTLLSVLWAVWQLYRHVNVIRFVIQPIINALKYYLSPVFELFDSFFAIFTVWWHTFLSPLNVLRTLLLAPMLQLLVHLKVAFAPLYQVFLTSGLASALVNTLSLLYRVFYSAGSSIWALLRVILTPVSYIFQYFSNSRLKVAAMDLQRLRISWAFNLILSSIRSIARGLIKVVGYQRQEKKIKKARENTASSPVMSPASVTPSSAARHRHKEKMPILYSSPLSKQQ